MRPENPFGGEIPVCSIRFNKNPANAHISQIIAGFELLKKQGIIKIQSIAPENNFRSRGDYEHTSIVEVKTGNKLIAYDMADGYQSFHRKDVFDSQLERLDYYFKRSFDPEFHKGIKNEQKIKPLGLNYFCTCKNNPYDKSETAGVNLSAIKSRLINQKAQNETDYKKFESDGKKYDEYNLLFLARIWDSSGINADSIQKTYPYLSKAEATAIADEWKESLETVTRDRIKYIEELKSHFGDKIIAGISRDSFSQKKCPHLLVDDSVSDKLNYIKMIKKNFVCIASEGLHRSIGWKFGEYVAAGKAILTEKPAYVIPGGFEEDKNYIVYDSIGSLISKGEALLKDVGRIHLMESENRKYYGEHLSPDKLILDTLKCLYRSESI